MFYILNAVYSIEFYPLFSEGYLSTSIISCPLGFPTKQPLSELSRQNPHVLKRFYR